MGEDEKQKRPERRRPVRRGHGAKSEDVRAKVILALVAGKSPSVAARTAGIGKATLGDWLRDTEFCAQLGRARRTAFGDGMARLQGLMACAVETLHDLMGKRQPPHVRLGAARAVADLAIHERDAHEFVNRLEALEAALAREQQRNGSQAA